MKEKALLVYAIQSNRTINVNLIIQHSILHGVNKDNVELYHSSFITDLCKVVGMVWSKDEEIQHPKWIIDAKLIWAMKDKDEDPGVRSGFAIIAMLARPNTMHARMVVLEAQVACFGQYHQSFVQHSPNPTFYTTSSTRTITTTT